MTQIFLSLLKSLLQPLTPEQGKEWLVLKHPYLGSFIGTEQKHLPGCVAATPGDLFMLLVAKALPVCAVNPLHFIVQHS
jgi:hypothetical protein